MTKQLHLIYLPGIGDAPEGSYQAKAVRTWRWWGVDSEVYELNWRDDITWVVKFQKLLERIDQLTKEGKSVALVGISAGASAAINAYAARSDSLVGIVCIAGKINRPETIGSRYRQNNPSFVTSAEAAPTALARISAKDRKRILSRYAILDTVVARSDSHIPGAHNRVVPSIGHVITIATQISLGAPSFIRFLKRQSANIK